MDAMREKIVVLGADHNGVPLKAEVKNFLNERGYLCIDVGPYEEQEKVDYVDYARVVSNIVNTLDARWGVLVCGTGVGMSMTANRYPNVRASLVHSIDVARKTREHNDANVLCLGAWVNPFDINLEIVRTWFNEPFGEGRHVKRVEKLKEHALGKIVFTNGIFDVLHVGHIRLLKFAKSLAGPDGKLVVAMNSDRATKQLKGKDRPIHNEHDRKLVLEGLGFVDQVLIFDDVSPIAIREHVHPDIVVKGGEWTAEEVRMRDKIAPDVEVRVFPIVEGYSSTKIISKIRGKNE